MDTAKLTDAELNRRRQALPRYTNNMAPAQLAESQSIYSEQLRRYKARITAYNKQAMAATGLQRGDEVTMFAAGWFGSGGEVYTGKVIYDRNGRLVIRTAKPDGSGRKTFSIHRGWKKTN